MNPHPLPPRPVLPRPPRRRVLQAAAALLAAPALAVRAQAGEAPVLVLRHAVTEPGVGDPPGYVLDRCETQRNLSAGIYVKNLADEVYKTDAQEFSSVGGIRTAYFGAPRTVMATVTLKY